MRLKTAKIMLMMTIKVEISIRELIDSSPAVKRMIVPNTKAKMRFETGPAAAIKNSPRRLSLRL